MKILSKRNIFIFTIITTIAVASFIVSKNKDDSITVTTGKVKVRQLIKTVSASGIIEPVKEVQISSSISATITSMLVKDGQKVKKGDLLVVFDKEYIESEVKQKEAILSQQTFNSKMNMARLKQSELDFKSSKELAKKNLISEIDFEKIKLNMEIAQTTYEASLESIESAKASLSQTMDQLSKTRLYSPLDGTVSKLFKEEGEMALGSQFNTDVILTISNLSGLQANVEVDENDVSRIDINDSVKISIDAFPDEIFKGIIFEISNSPIRSGVGSQDQSVSYSVKIRMLTSNNKIKPGMTSNVDIITDIIQNVISIPIQALTRRKKKDINNNNKDSIDNQAQSENNEGIIWNNESEYDDIVFKTEAKDKDEIVKLTRVTTGVANNRYIEIKKGLKEGDKIVIGSYKVISKELKDGKKINTGKKE